MQTLLFIFVGISLFLSILYYVYRKINAQYCLYQIRLYEIENSYLVNSNNFNDFHNVALQFFDYIDIGEKTKKEAENLYFPKKTTIIREESAHTMFEKLIEEVNNHPPVIAGIEQVILTIIPTQYIADLLINYAQSINIEMTVAWHESLKEINDSYTEGVANFSHETLGNCISQLCNNVFENFGQAPPHTISEFLISHLSSNLQNFVNASNAIIDTLDPSFHIQNHASNISHIFGHHIHNISHTAQHGLGHAMHAKVGGHFPVITIVLSSIREVNLLADSKTDFGNSIKNIALDTAGTVGGTFAGAKGGALFGSLFGPVGTMLGGIIGGIGGAIMGRKGSDAIKYIALNQAIQNYESKYEEMNNNLKNVVIDAQAEINNSIEIEHENYLKNLNEIQQPIEKDGLKKINHLRMHINDFYSEKSIELISLKASIFSKFSNSQSRLLKIETDLRRSKTYTEDTVLDNNFIQNIHLIPLPSDIIKTKKIDILTNELEIENKKNKNRITDFSLASASLYKNAHSTIANTVNKNVINFKNNITNWQPELLILSNNVLDEKKKLGLE